jgi:HD-GYP domain-containing protein (c-di-GMP phosphodiesterase class II)
MNEVSKIPAVSPEVVNIIWQHQERMDGSGYPEGIKGNDITFGTKIVTICDIYDALTAKRSYRNSLDVIESLRIMVNDTNSKLDREILQEFIKVIPIYPINSIVRLSNGQSGIVIGTTENPFRPLISLLDKSSQDTNIIIDLSLSKYFKMFIVENIKTKRDERK